MADDIVVINQGYELRTSKSGKTRCTVVVRSEPIVYSFDDRAIAKGPAMAVAEELRRAVENCEAPASQATIERRKRAAKELAKGDAGATRRYAGGRIGAMTPDVSDRLFNDSGRFAKSIVATWSEDSKAWRVNCAANRLDGATYNFETMWGKLTANVPVFGDPESVVSSFSVRRAIEIATEKLAEKKAARSTELELELVKSILEVARDVEEAGEGLAETG